MSSVNQVGMSGIVSMTAGAIPKDTAKIKQSAEQFESLLIGQILHSAQSSDGGWLGTEDSSSSSATDFAEEQLANTMAKQGGFGLAKMIERELDSRGSAPKSHQTMAQPHSRR
jgi:Rod binding domain-containing protein